jgi:hypothetical protein
VIDLHYVKKEVVRYRLYSKEGSSLMTIFKTAAGGGFIAKGTATITVLFSSTCE